MFMKQYVEFNISKKSNATIEYVLKMLANIMETIIFMFMGLSTISDHHSWNTGFVLITIASCTIYRILGVIIFANLANRWRLLELTMTDMLIMSYGGIRGAVVRGYDRRFFKPFLLRDKIMSKDEKLLNTFKKINEININKMAENPDFIFPSVSSMNQFSNMRSNPSIGNFLASGLVKKILIYPYFYYKL